MIARIHIKPFGPHQFLLVLRNPESKEQDPSLKLVKVGLLPRGGLRQVSLGDLPGPIEILPERQIHRLHVRAFESHRGTRVAQIFLNFPGDLARAIEGHPLDLRLPDEGEFLQVRETRRIHQPSVHSPFL